MSQIETLILSHRMMDRSRLYGYGTMTQVGSLEYDRAVPGHQDEIIGVLLYENGVEAGKDSDPQLWRVSRSDGSVAAWFAQGPWCSTGLSKDGVPMNTDQYGYTNFGDSVCLLPAEAKIVIALELARMNMYQPHEIARKMILDSWLSGLTDEASMEAVTNRKSDVEKSVSDLAAMVAYSLSDPDLILGSHNATYLLTTMVKTLGNDLYPKVIDRVHRCMLISL